MIIHLAIRIYPSRKYIMTPLNTENYSEVKKIVETVLSGDYEIPELILDSMYNDIRTTLISQNVVCFGKDKETNELCIYEFDVNVNSSYKIKGYDAEGIPYLEMLN